MRLLKYAMLCTFVFVISGAQDVGAGDAVLLTSTSAYDILGVAPIESEPTLVDAVAATDGTTTPAVGSDSEAAPIDSTTNEVAAGTDASTTNEPAAADQPAVDGESEAGLMAEIMRLLDERDVLNATIDQLKAENATLLAQAAESETHKQRVTELESEITRLESQLAETESALATADTRMAEMESQLTEEGALLADAEVAITAKDEELAAKDASIAERDQALADKDAALATAEAALLEAQTALAEAQAAETAAREETIASGSDSTVAVDETSEAVSVAEQKIAMLTAERDAALVSRDAAEMAKREAEAARAEAETSKTDADSAWAKAEAARAEAVAGRAAAETARSEAEAAKTEAEKAAAVAEKARVEAEAARNVAEAALAAAKASGAVIPTTGAPTPALAATAVAPTALAAVPAASTGYLSGWKLDTAKFSKKLRAGFDGSAARMGAWKISGTTASQTDASQYFSRLELPLAQTKATTLYRFKARSTGKGWVGLGLHLFVEDVMKKRGYGEGKSLLVWFTRDKAARGDDATYLQLYRSDDDVVMERMFDAELEDGMDAMRLIEILYDPSAEYIAISVDGVLRIVYKTFFGRDSGATVSLRTLGAGGSFSEFSAWTE